MLLFLRVTLLALVTVRLDAIIPLPHLIAETRFSLPPQDSSTAASDTPPSPNSTLTSTIVDPRFTYDIAFANEFLDKESAYMNTLLALADLSTKGWTPELKWEAIYSLSSYGDVTIRIHASQNPSTLQYRHAIWGLYIAIRETSAHGFRACVLTVYWVPDESRPRLKLGYVSILGGSSLGIATGNSTEKSLGLALPTQRSIPKLRLANLTTTINKFTTLITGKPDMTNLNIEISLLGRPLEIDAVFHTVYAGVLALAPWPQYARIDGPGVVEDHSSRTFLRWDSSYLRVQPTFEYRYLILALAKLPLYMYEQNRFEEARFVVYVDGIEVGRGWLYRRGVGGVSGAE
ncbi:hypothetical protein HO133_003792 [Letharia lupina]|uniref:Uncharacterized protein n=1 Tax=Letharia lupina TaxID=560253 RepID=A0A8H6F980_9LECA|nr:uncharacterized protein HO133_003792 [Letharia lupina]KAF6219967.1 hypothetical protein HO133_003792 [Letharia lupina]